MANDGHLIAHHEAQYHSFSPALAEHVFQAIQRIEQSNNGLVVGGLGLGEPALVHSCGLERFTNSTDKHRHGIYYRY